MSRIPNPFAARVDDRHRRALEFVERRAAEARQRRARIDPADVPRPLTIDEIGEPPGDEYFMRDRPPEGFPGEVEPPVERTEPRDEAPAHWVSPLPERPTRAGAPEPLARPMPPAAEYPLEALGPVLSPAAAAIRRVVQSPAAICASSVLAAASLVAQRRADVELDGRRVPLSLWLVTIAASGERKSATDSPALTAIREFEREQMREYRFALAEYEVALREWQKDRRASRDADPEPRPEPPLIPMLATSEPTLEGLHKLLLNGIGSIGLFSDEGGLFFGGHAMNRDNQLKTVAGLSGLWDRGEADRVRAGDGVAKIFGKRLALHLLAQPTVAERVLADELLTGQGFLARCLLAWPESTAGRRPYVAESLADDPAMVTYHARLRALLSEPLPLAEGTRNELEPPALRLTPEAKALWIDAHDAIEVRQAPAGEYSTIRPWASKAAEQVLRVAGVFAVIESRREIGVDLIERACLLVDWHLGEALRLVGTAQVPRDIRDAEAVLTWCHDRRLRLVHSGQLVRCGPASVRTADRLRVVMAVLERHGWATPIEGGAEIDKAHRRHAWRIHPPLED
jgi:hypothetical protein